MIDQCYWVFPWCESKLAVKPMDCLLMGIRLQHKLKTTMLYQHFYSDSLPNITKVNQHEKGILSDLKY